MQISHPVRLVAASDYNPGLVAVNKTAISQLPKDLRPEAMSAVLDVTSEFGADAAAYVPYLVVMDTLNFQFWDVDASGQMQRYAKDGVVGALAMQKSFEAAWRALADNAGYTGPAVMQGVAAVLRERIAREGVSFILGDIPAADKRQQVLLEVLEPVKLQAVTDQLVQVLLTKRTLGAQEAQFLAQQYPVAYGDRYLKKAQLTLMFVAAQRNGKADLPVEQRCTVEGTACADYQLPKVLRELGLLDYSQALAELVDTETLIAADSAEERAIRAATVLACDELVAHFDVDIASVDFWLWVNRNRAKNAKFHLTRTTDY